MESICAIVLVKYTLNKKSPLRGGGGSGGGDGGGGGESEGEGHVSRNVDFECTPECSVETEPVHFLRRCVEIRPAKEGRKEGRESRDSRGIGETSHLHSNQKS